jgi:putative MATE family efflux protein
MQDLTKGSISQHLIKTASFMLVTMVFQTLYFLVDLYWVGRLGKEAVAGVGVAGNLTFIVLAISQMLGVGTTTLVSHAAGRKDHERALLVFNQSQVLSMLAGGLFLLIAMIFRVPYAERLSGDAQTAALAASYLLWFLPAMGLQFCIVAMGAALRGIGNFKPGMVVQTSTVIINIILAPILIFGWGTGVALGVTGAAIATLVAVIVGVAWLSTYFIGTDAYLKFVKRDLNPQLKLWGDMLKIGLPAGAEFGMMAIYLMIVYVIAKPFGSAAQAGFSIGMRVVQSLFMPVVALGFAVAPVAGQNFGAKRGDRVKQVFKTACLMGGGAMFLMAILCNIGGAELVRLFSRDPEVVTVGDEYLRIVSWNFVASGLVFVSSSMFQAMGNTVPSLIASFCRILFVAIPAIILSKTPDFALNWIWYLSVAAVVVQLGIVLSFLRREFKRRLDTMPAAPLVTSAPATS